MIALALAAALFAPDGAAAEASTPATAPSAPAAAKPNKDGMICKREAVVGTRLASKVCMTADQWEERKRSSREAMENAQRTAKPLPD